MRHKTALALKSTTSHPALLETKDESAIGEVKRAVDGMMSAFEEFKKTNDQRLKEIKEKGAPDPATTEKLAKIEATISGFEAINQKVTAADLAAKAANDDLKKLQGTIDALEKRLNRPGAGGTEERREDLKKRVNLWMRGVIGAHALGESNLPEEQRKVLAEIANEWKSLSITNDTTGGYLAPKEYDSQIIKSVTEMSPVRLLVRVRTIGSKSLMIPKRTGQFAARRTTEQGTRSETDGLRFGMVEINAPEMYALIDISQQNLEDSGYDLEAELSFEATEQFAVKEGTEFISGTGVGEMEGILSNSGVGTVNSGAATTITADGLLALFYGIKTAYSRNATFTLNRTTLGSVRKLKDGNGQYLWVPGLASGVPNTINGAPYVEMPDMPNEGAGLKPVAFGDFRRAYTLVDRLGMTMLRDPFTQATSGNIRFLFRRRVGGQVVLAEAIKTLTCA